MTIRRLLMAELNYKMLKYLYMKKTLFELEWKAPVLLEKLLKIVHLASKI